MADFGELIHGQKLRWLIIDTVPCFGKAGWPYGGLDLSKVGTARHAVLPVADESSKWQGGAILIFKISVA